MRVTTQATWTALALALALAAGCGGWARKPVPTSNTLRSIIVPSFGPVIAVGDLGTIVHPGTGENHDDGTADESGTQADLLAVAEDTKTPQLWAVGAGGTALKSLGQGKWTAVPTGVTCTLRGLFAADGQLWTTCDDRVLEWNNGAWSPVAVGLASSLQAIAGSSSHDVWAVGAAGAVLHFDGTSWTRLTAPRAEDLFAVAAHAPDDVWVGGSTLVHFNGQDFQETPAPIPTGSVVHGLDFSFSTPTAVGDHALVLTHDVNGWERWGVPTGQDLFSVFHTQFEEGWIVGAAGTVLNLIVEG